MKLHFEPDLDYQKLAIESVADLFRGQEINRTEFTVTRRPNSLLTKSRWADSVFARSGGGNQRWRWGGRKLFRTS